MNLSDAGGDGIRDETESPSPREVMEGEVPQGLNSSMKRVMARPSGYANRNLLPVPVAASGVSAESRGRFMSPDACRGAGLGGWSAWLSRAAWAGRLSSFIARAEA